MVQELFNAQWHRMESPVAFRNSGKFVWPREGALTATLSRSQFDALVLGLPWQRLGDGGVITVI